MNWEPVLTDLLSEFPVVVHAVARGSTSFIHVSGACGCWCHVLMQCSCKGLLWWGEHTEERPPRGSLGSSICSSPFARVQPQYGAEWDFPPCRVLAAAWHTFCICLLRAFPTQVATTAPQISRGCLQLAQTWTEFWQLYHCVRPVWAMYNSTLMIIW
jgi:hypothetical protein